MTNNAKVLITGGSGFTAPYMAELLKRQDMYVVATSSNPKDEDFDRDCYDELLKLDLGSYEQVSSVINKVKPNYVVHLAGISFVGHEDMNAFYGVNVLGTENLLLALDNLTAGVVKGVLVASSANIYGTPQKSTDISEEIVPCPLNHYAISKLAMEFVAKKFMLKLPIVIARPFNYIGFGQKSSFVIPKIVSAYALKAEKIELGSLNVSRDFTSVYDTVAAYERLLLNSRCYGEVFNVCSSKLYSLSQIIDLMTDITGFRSNIVTNPLFVRRHEIKELSGSSSKLRNATEWTPRISMQDALTEMYHKYVSKLS